MATAGRLSGSTAIVTAAGQGLGETIAKTFAREGASVAVVDINLPEVTRVGAEIEGGGRRKTFRINCHRDGSQRGDRRGDREDICT